MERNLARLGLYTAVAQTIVMCYGIAGNEIYIRVGVLEAGVATDGIGIVSIAIVPIEADACTRSVRREGVSEPMITFARGSITCYPATYCIVELRQRDTIGIFHAAVRMNEHANGDIMCLNGCQTERTGCRSRAIETIGIDIERITSECRQTRCHEGRLTG